MRLDVQTNKSAGDGKMEKKAKKTMPLVNLFGY